MEKTLYSTFLDDESVKCQIFNMLANNILGLEQQEKIKLRYDDMRLNFLNFTKYEVKKRKESGRDAEVWKFSKGLEPFTPKGWGHYYEDTCTVSIPITHPNFIDLTIRAEKRGAIGLDLPTWFNLENSDKRIMLIAQDPLRDNRWYSDVDEFPKGKIGSREDYVCTEALVSSPFGLHDRSWRENKCGGGRMKLLVEALIGYGYGIYLTDCRKYFVYDHKESAKYSKDKKDLYRIILQKEIDIIKPVCIVAMGNQARAYCQDLLGDDHNRLKHVPHFSGAATWQAKKEFFKGENRKVSIEELAGAYVKRISEFCQTLKIQLIAADQMYHPYHFQTYHPPKSNQCQLQRVIRGGCFESCKMSLFLTPNI